MFFRKLIKTWLSPNNKGFAIIEALIGITIAAMLLTAFSMLILQTIKIDHANANGLKATMYLQELIEIAKDLEQSATSTIFAIDHPCTNCHPEASGTAWTLVPGVQPPLEGIFTRSITIGPVSRDIDNNNIEAMYNVTHDDPNTKIATATISWNDGIKDNTSTLETYLYYYDQ